ncbi:MAG: hypothetical protein RL632_247 [Bacteroidota bacterium]|jgi:hypothetical protein
MSGEHRSRIVLWPLFTIGGILLFTVFYLLAAHYYPGGSNVNVHEPGFSWRNNYWCELLGENAKNGAANSGRSFGLVGMVILSVSISIFWWNVPTIVYEKNKSIRGFMRYCGILSMIFSSLIFTNWHDGIIYVAVISGTIAFTLLFYELFRNKRDFLSYFGVVCLGFIFANGIIYISNFGIVFLPLLQKITFGLTLLWIILVILQLKKHAYSHSSW